MAGNDIELGTLIADRYRLLERIGGARTDVYSAMHVFLRREVAVKVLHSLGGRASVFEREAQTLGRLRHSNIVEVYDAGIDRRGRDQLGYIAMERLTGETLKQRVVDSARLTVPEISTLLFPVLQALEYLHGKGVVHRDIKPSNVFLADGRGGPLTAVVPKLLDFGLSLNGTGPEPSGVTGTIRYLSPEQLEPGVELDERIDIWAIGVMLYRLLTGTLPFDGGRHEVLMQIVGREPPPPSFLCTTLPTAIDDVVMCAMSKKRERRFRSVAELASAWTSAAGERRDWRSGMHAAREPDDSTSPAFNE